MISYTHHPEEETTKAHTDILLDNKYIGYFIKNGKKLVAFFEYRTEMYAGDFQNTKQLELTINKIIKTN